MSVFFRFSNAAAILPMVLLGACGSTSGGEAPPDPLNFSSTQSALDQVLVLEDLLVSSPTPIDQLPSGSVSYNGLIAVSSDATDIEDSSQVASDPLFAVGQMTIDADFSNGAVTGVGDHFIDGNDNQIEGELVLDAGTNFMGSGPGSFVGTIAGDILPANGYTHSYDLEVEGSFLGGNAETVVGGGSGDFDLTTSGVTETIPFFIGFIAQQ